MRYINPTFLCCLALPLALLAGPASSAADDLVEAGIRAYHDGNYKAAAQTFREAISAAPRDSVLHHWLGRCYGRMAEQGNWLSAPSYAKKTLEQFRRAVQLDANNYEALRDLAAFLEQAPGFVGGDRKEAKRLRQRLETLRPAPETGDEYGRL